MTKRLFSTERVLEALLADDEDDIDCDDPNEPIMDGSDDDFSDLEFDEDDAIDDLPQPTSPVLSSPPASTSTCSQPTSNPLLSSLLCHSPASPQVPPHHSPSISPSPVPPAPPAAWTSTIAPVEIKQFNSPVGPTTHIPESPKEVFELFFSDDLMQLMVLESNRYAEEVMGSEKFQKWTKISVEEMKAFLGFSILMGICQLPSIKDYWKKNEYLHYSPIADRIPRDRFLEISRYVHFTDNATLQPRGSSGHDRLGKVRPIINHLSVKFSELYHPHKEVAVDKAMVKFQGRSSLKQYMPMKPVKRGIKVWVLGDSHTGYFSKFDIYCGKSSSSEKNLATRVVKSLTEPLKGKFHHVYFDNFFTSERLVTELEEDGLYACGTARKDRRGFPEQLKKVNLKSRYKIMHNQLQNLV